MDVTSKHKVDGERGQSLVELAVSFTLLMMLLAGSVDLGRALFTLITLHDAAQEGALYGAINPGDTNEIEERVRGTSNAPLDLSDPSVTAVTVSFSGGACAGATNAITVAVDYQFQLSMPIIGMFVPSQTITLPATATMRILSPEC